MTDPVQNPVPAEDQVETTDDSGHGDPPPKTPPSTTAPE